MKADISTLHKPDILILRRQCLEGSLTHFVKKGSIRRVGNFYCLK
jgi:hypothetical protein